MAEGRGLAVADRTGCTLLHFQIRDLRLVKGNCEPGFLEAVSLVAERHHRVVAILTGEPFGEHKGNTEGLAQTMAKMARPFVGSVLVQIDRVREVLRFAGEV